MFFYSSDPAVSSSIFVGAEGKENWIRNYPDKKEFTNDSFSFFLNISLDAVDLFTRNKTTHNLCLSFRVLFNKGSVERSLLP